MIIVLCAVIFVASMALFVFGDRNDHEWAQITGGCFMIVFGIGLLISLAALPISRMQIHSEIAQFNQARESLEYARENPSSVSPIELAAIQQKIIEMNQWLASVQYYAKNPWLAPYYPDEVMDLEMIR